MGDAALRDADRLAAADSTKLVTGRSPSAESCPSAEGVPIPLAQLPDSRRAILTELKARGIATIAHLAGVLHLTGEAVRQQLLQLKREGWIEAAHGPDSDRNRTGRPAAFFKLTAAGDHLFPKAYDVLAVALLEAVDREGAIEQVLERLTEDRVTASESFRDLPFAAKVNALKALYVSDDPYMDVETVSDGFRLVERNCPYYNVAMQSPSICSISVNALTRALGVRVAREETFQAGDGRCAFHIFANEPTKTSSS